MVFAQKLVNKAWSLVSGTKICDKCGLPAHSGYYVRDRYKGAPKLWLCEDNGCFYLRRQSHIITLWQQVEEFEPSSDTLLNRRIAQYERTEILKKPNN